MAFTVPERLSDQHDMATPGERKVFAALRDHLPEDYLVYYDIRVGDRYPDFTIIGSDLGVVVLEVKDWRLRSIVGVRPDCVMVRTSDGEHEVRSPVPQARDYTYRIVDLLKQRPKLRNGKQLCCGWGFGAVLPSLGADDLRTPSRFGTCLEETLGPGLILTAHDLTAEHLLPRLDRGVAPDDILVLGLARPQIERLTSWLADAGVPASLLLTDPVPGTVRLSTIHSAKGLDAAHVLLFAVHELQNRGDEEARRLLYIAMTRAREELCVCYHRASALMEELRQIVG